MQIKTNCTKTALAIITILHTVKTN